jgi:hypothetical protein
MAYSLSTFHFVYISFLPTLTLHKPNPFLEHIQIFLDMRGNARKWRTPRSLHRQWRAGFFGIAPQIRELLRLGRLSYCSISTTHTYIQCPSSSWPGKWHPIFAPYRSRCSVHPHGKSANSSYSATPSHVSDSWKPPCSFPVQRLYGCISTVVHSLDTLNSNRLEPPTSIVM